ncbi:hypothetical protein HD554DRAFT_1820573 [Boletus coccyginus]|nr:hypothetical protein HD554DRAFT_1820573 [Boletus coccyginus]
MDRMVEELRLSSPDLAPVEMLYNRLHGLPFPSLAASRLHLPGIVFPLTELDRIPESDPTTDIYVYRATMSTFGEVEIKTTEDLTGMKDFCLVHPWIPALLDQEHLAMDGATSLDKTARALRLVARLRQPFGALLFAPFSRVEYRRVAADALIMIRISEETSLTSLMDNVRMIDVQ